MAQLVEQRIRNAWVGGSSPPIGLFFMYKYEKQGGFYEICISSENLR